jgi:hypothetical protein
LRHAILIVCLLAAFSLAAQPFAVGTQIADQGGTTTTTLAAPVSYVNLTNYAPANGTVNKANVSWSATCPAAFKIVFLRANFATLSSFNVVATRGPFDAVSGRNEVSLDPPVALLTGDLIGVVQLQPVGTCGSVRTQPYGGKLGFNLITTSDLSVSGTLGTDSNFSPGYDIGAIAFNSNPLLARVIPVAGAVQGSSAFFRTSLQLLNPTSTTITGSLVFHPQGQPANPADPALPFTLPGNQSISFPDVVASMNTSGLGSLDILTNGGAVPLASARVFSDGGSAGTSGFSEEGLLPADAPDSFARNILLIPSDLTNFRMNIGVRTLDAGAKLTIIMIGADGTVRSTRSGVTYPPNYFVQVPVAEFTGATTVEPGGWILITPTFPTKAFIYSSVIDNRTSDSTYRLAEVK